MSKGIMSFRMLKFTFMELPFLIVILFSFIFLVGNFVQVNVDTLDMEAKLLAHRMLYTGLAYTDKTTGRVYPYTIDLDKDFSSIEKELLKKIKYDRKISAKYSVYKGKKIREGYYNKDTYTFLLKLIDLRGNPVQRTKVGYPIRLRNPDGSTEPGKIVVEVIQAT